MKKSFIRTAAAMCVIPLLLAGAACTGNRKEGNVMSSKKLSSSTGTAETSSPAGEASESQMQSTASAQAGSTEKTPSGSTRVSSKAASTASINPNPISALISKTLPAMTAEDSKELNKNPDRGFRYEMYMHVGDIEGKGPEKEPMVKYALNEIKKNVEQYANGEYVTVAYVYVYMNAYRVTGVDDAGIAALDAMFEAFRRSGIKLFLNFCYQKDVGVPGAKESILLADIRKLAPVVAKNKDTIHTLQIAFAGAFGEWHSINPPVNLTTLIAAVANNLCPSDTYMIARLPSQKNLLPQTNPAYKRIGFFNASFWGKEEGPGSGGMDPGTDQWDQWVKQGPYTPNDGEMYVGKFHDENNRYPEAFSSIQTMSEHRYTTFSFFHGYGDVYLPTSALGRWKNVEITEDILKAKGYSFVPGWFRDKSGSKVKRNAFEYVRDHLGYKLEAGSLKVVGTSAKGKTINIDMSLVNCGFGAAFNLKSGFAILDSDNKEVASVAAGVPSDWHPTSPANYNSRGLIVHKLNANMKLPAASGRYKLAFYVKNDMGQFARLGNNIDYVNGYNVLHTFDI